MSDPLHDHPLRQRLIVTQERLQTSLEEVCLDVQIDAKATDELIRIEEALVAAAEDAKQAVSLRRRLDADRS